jgi:hypothetical protein
MRRSVITLLVAVALLVPAAAQATVLSQAVSVAVHGGACKPLRGLEARYGAARTKRLFVLQYEQEYGYSHRFAVRFFDALQRRCP